MAKLVFTVFSGIKHLHTSIVPKSAQVLTITLTLLIVYWMKYDYLENRIYCIRGSVIKRAHFFIFLSKIALRKL